MHNLLRCRRGSAAFATVAALVPLIGVVALGGEAGSWYVTKQHAQNAAMLQPIRVPYGWHARTPQSVIKHKTMSIRANNLPHGMVSATRAVLRQVRRKPCRSISRPALAFVPLLASTSQDICQECLVCFRAASTSALKPSPKSRTRKTYVFGTGTVK